MFCKFNPVIGTFSVQFATLKCSLLKRFLTIFTLFPSSTTAPELKGELYLHLFCMLSEFSLEL